MELLKLLSVNEIVAQVVSFLVLFIILRVFLWKRILGLLDARKEKIASALSEIENAKLEADKLKNDYQGKLNLIDKLAQDKINEAVAKGRHITDEMRKIAHEEAQAIIESARANAKYELSKAQEQLKEKIVDLTIAAAGSVIQEKLTEEDDRKLVEDFLNRMDKA